LKTKKRQNKKKIQVVVSEIKTSGDLWMYIYIYETRLSISHRLYSNSVSSRYFYIFSYGPSKIKKKISFFFYIFLP
jgi:hypothetical protein